MKALRTLLRTIILASMDPEVSEKLTELRKLERQAKQLIYKMERIEAAWNQVKTELKEKGKVIAHELGDVVHSRQKKVR